MKDYLAIIREAISEHHAIRQHVKLASDSVTDMEALFSLQKAHSTWAQSSVETLSEKQRQLQQVLERLDQGLKNHFGFEERALPPILGEILMKALVLEHRNIGKRIDQAKTIVANARLEALSQEQLLSQKAQLQDMMGNISQMIEEHASEEELIFGMLQRALEAGAQSQD